MSVPLTLPHCGHCPAPGATLESADGLPACPDCEGLCSHPETETITDEAGRLRELRTETSCLVCGEVLDDRPATSRYELRRAAAAGVL